MNKEEIEAIEYFEHKIKTKLPLYEETYVDGKPYRRNILQLETNFTEEQANKTQVILNLIDKLQKENEELKEDNKKLNDLLMLSELDYVSKDKIRDKIKELEERDKMFKLELPEDVTIYQYGIEVLKELLGE